MNIDLTTIFRQVDKEVSRARLLFPDNRFLLHAFVEEAGEVTKAFLDTRQKKATGADVQKELIQTIAMAVRLLQEGDPDFPISLEIQ